MSRHITRRALLSAGGVIVLAAGINAVTAATTSEPLQESPRLPAGPGKSVGGARPGSGSFGPEYYVAKGPKAIALTLDDGPDARYTPQVLEVLRAYGVTATFCMIGSSARAQPEVVRAVAAEGHLIANHTFTHPNLARLSASQVQTEIERTNQAIEQVTGERPSLFRAPYGAWTPSTFQACRSLGLQPLGWSVDPRDWSRPGTAGIAGVILRQTRPGSIIVEHDGPGSRHGSADRSQTVAALHLVLPRLLEAGYHFVTP